MGTGNNAWIDIVLPLFLCLVLLRYVYHGSTVKYEYTSYQRKTMYQGRKFNQNRQHILEPFLPPHHDSRKARFISLDTFRGLTLTCMIFVNYGGGGYAFFTHSIWNGLTFADLLFPWFAYIMGFSVVLSNPTSFSKILKRSSKLFLLGLFLNNGQDWYHWRLPGVLQALSIANLIVSVANFTTKRLDFLKRFHYRQLIFHLFMIFVIVAFNLSMVFHLPVPGCPSGYLGPGGIDAKGKFKNCTGGAHLYLDTLIFGGHNHLYQHPTCQEKYSTGPFDPEGFLNWLMITATTYLGFCTAVLLLDKQKHVYSIHQQVKMIVLGGISLLLLSIPSCGLLLHQPWIPINKNLWSLSYVLVSTGIGSIVFACLLFCIDGGTAIWRSGKPFVCMGKNSIFIYVMHEVFEGYFPFSAKLLLQSNTTPHITRVLMNFCGMLCWMLVAQWMDKRHIYIKV